MSRVSKEGLPEFFIKDIPAVSLADIKVTRPEIYFGELSNEYVIVKTKVPEFSYPTATGNINTTYGDNSGNVPNAVSFFSGSYSDTGSLGTQLSDSSIATIVSNGINSGALGPAAWSSVTRTGQPSSGATPATATSLPASLRRPTAAGSIAELTSLNA